MRCVCIVYIYSIPEDSISEFSLHLPTDSVMHNSLQPSRTFAFTINTTSPLSTLPLVTPEFIRIILLDLCIYCTYNDCIYICVCKY